MIDDHPDPGTDPLAGRDPHPRTQIDLWPLHDALQKGDVLGPQQCRQLRLGRHRPGQDLTTDELRVTLEELSYVVRLHRKDGKPRWVRLLHTKDDHFIGVDKDCTVVVIDRLKVEETRR